MVTRKNTKKVPATKSTDILGDAGKAQQVNSGVATETASVQARVPKGTAGDAKVKLNPAKPHTPRVGHNTVAWEQLMADIAAGLTVGEMVLAANKRADEYTANQGRYIRYTMRRGWTLVA